VLQEEIEDLAFSTARQRLLKLLNRLCAEYQERAGAQVCIVKFSQEELGRMLGLTRERVNAVVNELKERSVLEPHYGSITADREKLRRFLEEQERG
jgi:CRP/FNR family transcriptional regulator